VTRADKLAARIAVWIVLLVGLGWSVRFFVLCYLATGGLP
jgi:hypothetical protein